ncbi:hypothetical protein THIOM_000899 [Candidatus Thiomargarita nelsonii]|uniref:Uncharacterized protein n=1 Tax=Candidatus Thiomargarita nelsonii TaxID=1003181 RepID=A0A176S575_9GAMM|nr:hypothetical protein THIOM_000899 [Candidatus Thiomargarita nelsonii]
MGSLQQLIQVDSLLAFIRRLLTVENPTEKLEQLSHAITEVFQLAPSNKHMNHRILSNTNPSEYLKSKGEIVCA